MSKVAPPKKTYELVAIIFLIPALFIAINWILVSAGHQHMSQEARNATFLEAFPSFISSAKLLLIVCLACAIAAVVFASKSFNQPKIAWRISSFAVVFIGAVIALFAFFQIL